MLRLLALLALFATAGLLARLPPLFLLVFGVIAQVTVTRSLRTATLVFALLSFIRDLILFVALLT